LCCPEDWAPTNSDTNSNMVRTAKVLLHKSLAIMGAILIEDVAVEQISLRGRARPARTTIRWRSEFAAPCHGATCQRVPAHTSARFIFLIGYIGPPADSGERVAQRSKAGHLAGKTESVDYPGGPGDLKNSALFGGSASKERKMRGKSMIFGAIRAMSSCGLVLRRARACRVPVPPRNILTKRGRYTISLSKE